MGKSVILSTILVVLFIANVSDAALFWNYRKLVASSPKEDRNASSSPIPSPILPEKQSSQVGGEEMGKKKQNQASPPSISGDKYKDKMMANNTNTPPLSPTTVAKEHSNKTTHKENVKEKEKEIGKEKENDKAEQKEEEKEKENEKGEQKEEEKEKENEKGEQKEEEKEKKKEKAEEKEEEKKEQKEKEERKSDIPVGSDESCDGKGRCQDLNSMIACIKSFDHDSKVLVLLIQNKGDSNLKVDLTTSSPGNKHETINIPKLRNKLVNTSLSNSGINEVTLNAGNGHCVLHLSKPISQGNFFQQIPLYSRFMTPIYGAYLMLVITLIAGGVFACCCWFRKRKTQHDVPYQELEMSMPESALAVETAEGWDEVWDDDWDEENAVRSPGGHNISANGLTTRSFKKGDWEDWDD